MNKDQYINAKSVRSFIEWISPRIDEPNLFKHTYILKRPRGQQWECNSLYSAFENYNWSFQCSHPLSNNKITGNSFQHSKVLLDELSHGLRESVKQNNESLCQAYCLSILDWGGVLPKNNLKIRSLNPFLVSYLTDVSSRLNPDKFDTSSNYDDIIMNAGFTKIYSLLIDKFIIYDSRVGAALGLLVRKYCEEEHIEIIPKELLFAYGNAKGDAYGPTNRRSPSTKNLKFPLLGSSYKKHTENNIRANWLLGEIIDKSDSKFNNIDYKVRLRALEAALFMIGYAVNSGE